MEINEMKLDDIQVRKAEIVARRDAITLELESEEVDLDALEKETADLNDEERMLNDREAAIYQAAEERQKELQDVMDHGTEVQNFEREEKSMTNLEVRKTQEYAEAYAEYIKTGDDKECRALLTENVSGTVPVAEYAEDRVRTAWNREGIMSRVRKTYLKGNLKIGWEKSADSAYVHTEAANTAVTEESLVLGVTNLTPQSIKKWISISDEVMDMKGTAFLDYIYDELTYQIAKKAADVLVAAIVACTAGGSNDHPMVESVTATTVTLGLTAKALAKLSDEAANPVIIMNKATWGSFKAVQAEGNYGYDPFEGLPVVFNNSLSTFDAATTGVCYAIVGDLGIGAQANFPNGDEINIKVDELSKMEYDLVRILGREYVGLGVVAPNAFCKIVH
ncbi:MAG: phage major capsid protein [Lachnospiraceae bacterium]|nr:phage major capsid protein [Lachnospiraceae bacterium]